MAKTKHISLKEAEIHGIGLDIFPNFHKSGSIKGMKKLYYGKNALLVRCGNYIYKVTEEIYNLID